MWIGKNPITSRQQLWRALVILTVAAIVFSVFVTVLALKLTTTGDPDAIIYEHEIWAHALVIAVVTPTIVCPLVVYALLTTLHELNLARAELDAVARHDHLTGLLNRRGFDAAADALVSRARLGRHAVSALMCDIDDFKLVNDTHGHDCGDAAIRHVASIIRSVIADLPEAIAGRHGGDEFAILLSGQSIRDVAHHAEAISLAAAAAPFRWQGKEIALRVSVGTSICTADEADGRTLLSQADQALYEAKKHGRDRDEEASRVAAA